MNPCQASMTAFFGGGLTYSICCHIQAVYVWKETRKKRRGAVQVERGAGEAGGRSEAAGTDEWHKPEQLHHKKPKEQ